MKVYSTPTPKYHIGDHFFYFNNGNYHIYEVNILAIYLQPEGKEVSVRYSLGVEQDIQFVVIDEEEFNKFCADTEEELIKRFPEETKKRLKGAIESYKEDISYHQKKITEDTEILLFNRKKLKELDNGK